MKIKLKPKKHKHLARGSKIGNALQTRLRVGRSFLNQHSFTVGHSDTPVCQCGRNESVDHYLNNCQLYTQERNLLYQSISKLVPNFERLTTKKKTEILLYGINLDSLEPDCRNIRIMMLVQKFIFQTKRFKNCF